MSVDNKRVREIINHAITHAITHARNTGHPCCGAVRRAWIILKTWRDLPPQVPGARPNSLDLEVAAAENYMYARSTVCMGLVTRFQMNTMGLAYYASKRFVSMPTSGNPQSEPDLGVVGWGGIGSEEGEADRMRCNRSADPPIWRPVNEIVPILSGYSGYLGTPGTSGYTPPGRT
jgi:hypothetical protein